MKPDAADCRACVALTHTMPSAVCVAGAVFTDLPHKRFLVVLPGFVWVTWDERGCPMSTKGAGFP